MENKASKPGWRGWLLLAVATACSVNLSAGEKIEIVGGGVKLPERKSFLDERNSSFDVLTDKPDMTGGFAVPNIPIPNSAAQELLREADRKKNWIYLNPYEQDKRTTGLEKLEKKESSNPLEIEEKDQSVLERYLTEKKRRTEERQQLRRDDSRLERDGFRDENRYDTFSARSMEMDRRLADGDDREFARELSLNSFLNPGTVPGREEARNPYEKNHFSFQTVGDRAQGSAEQQADLQLQEEQRSAAFQRLLQPRSITPSIAGVVDPIGGSADPSREAYNPIAPERRDPLDFGRSSGTASYDTPAWASSAARPSLPTIERSSALDEIGSRAPQAAVFSSPAPTVERSSGPVGGDGFTGSGFSFEIPRRKF